MKIQSKILLALALSGLITGASADGLFSGKIGAGLTAAKGLSLSDADVVQTANEACAASDELNPVAPASNAYAKRLAGLVKGLENEDGLKLDFKVYLVRDVNAFAMANGCVRVFAGLMDKASDSELLGVIGHEIGHAKLGHTKKKMKAAMLTRAAREGVAASGGKGAELAQSELGGLAEDFINAQFSQKEESEADVYGYHFMIRHKFDPNGLVTLFEKLPSSGGLMSSHPASPKRAEKIRKLIAKG